MDARIRHRPALGHCGLLLPGEWTYSVRPSQTLCVTWQPVTTAEQGSCRTAYLGWNGVASGLPALQSSSTISSILRGLGHDVHGDMDNSLPAVEIDAEFATMLGLVDGQRVRVDLPKGQQKRGGTKAMSSAPPLARSVTVEPFDHDDWEIVELNAQYIEREMLSQIRVVSPGLGFVLRVHGQAAVRLRVVDIEAVDENGDDYDEDGGEDVSYAQLSNDTEVYVAAKARPMFGDVHGKPWALRLRGVPVEYVQPDTTRFTSDTIAISKLLADRHPTTLKDGALVGIIPLQTKIDPETGRPLNDAHDVRMVMRLRVIDGDELKMAVGKDMEFCANECLLSVTVMQALQVDVYSWFKIIPWYGEVVEPLEPITLWPLGTDMPAIATMTAALHAHNFTDQPVIANDGAILRFHDLSFLVELNSVDNGMELASLLTSGEQVKFGEHLVERAIGEVEVWSDPGIAGVEEVMDELETLLDPVFTSSFAERKNPCTILLHGPHGSGRTSILQKVAHDLHYDLTKKVHITYIRCSDIAGAAPVDELMAVVKEQIMGACECAPSLIVMDDIDHLFNKDPENTPLLTDFMDMVAAHLGANNPIALLATCERKEALHPLMIDAQFFFKTITVTAPTSDQRDRILTHILATREIPHDESFSCRALAKRMDGFLPVDLVAITERAVHHAFNRTNGMGYCVRAEDVERAMKTYTPRGLAGVTLHKSGTTWADVGGLRETKTMLLETIQWPTRYAPVFAKCQLKLRSGLLLYGPPGCGKTMIASAVAGQCGLNFLSVKGPELLNKYIGASEQAVREVFDRAQAARPCLLFFDEFDAIAPRRGHDNTGVTDRVVNQLLTQLDGADELHGVFVLAATNRPDLIDPALLRPGRLDKLVYCGIPTADEATEILEILAQTVPMAEDSGIDWKDVARRCPSWTSADLQALVSSAQLEAIHERIEPMTMDGDVVDVVDEVAATTQGNDHDLDFSLLRLDDRHVMDVDRARIQRKVRQLYHHDSSAASGSLSPNGTTSTTMDAAPLLVTAAHIERAHRTIRPSLPLQEQLRYQKIYRDFIQGKVNAEQPKRATMA